jgi:phosphotransferase system enzyme I (PtsI)
VFERKVVIRLNEGLHARPATQFVKLARSFASDIEVLKQGKSANAKSAVKLMLLGVKEHEEVVVRGEGEDAEAAVSALCAYAGQEEQSEASPPPSEPEVAAASFRRGVAASGGAAVGAAFVYMPDEIVAPRRVLGASEVAAELRRLRSARESVDQDLKRRAAAAPPDRPQAEIVVALMEIVADEDLVARMEAKIAAGLDAVTAVIDVGAETAREFEGLSDAYLKARGEDVLAVARHIALALLGKRDASLAEAPSGAILLADEISAFDLAGVDLGRFAGLVSLKGGATSHVAIIARAYDLPAVMGFEISKAEARAARVVALDGATGEVRLDPDAATQDVFRARAADAARRRQEQASYAHIEPRTRDGRLIEVAANLGSLSEIEAAKRAGAMGVGLFRTELLFMERKRPPNEDEQTKAYAALAQAFAPAPVIVRTLDIGGDKATPGISIPREDNPFLGWRGVRFCLDRPDIFKPQLRALLRASVGGNIKVMVPMVSDVGEIRQVKKLIEESRAELAAEGVAHGVFELGIMAETPAAALGARELAREVAFFSIGTNDLTQYVMAADRMNPRVAGLYRVDHPAVLAAVRLIAEAAREAGIWVGVCGEAAAKPEMIAKFVELGVTEISMSPSSIPMAKKCVSEL